MYVEQLKTARERLGKVIQDARKIGLDMNAKIAAKEAHAEVQQAFERARADVTQAQLEVQNLQGLADLEVAEKQAQAPLDPEIGIQRVQGSYGQSVRNHTEWVQNSVGRRTSDAQHLSRYQMTHSAHHSAFGTYIRCGGSMPQDTALRLAAQAAAEMMGKKPSEVNIHSIVDDTLGGFLVSEDWRAQVIRALPGYTVVRSSGARVIQTSKAGVTFPVVNRATQHPKQYTSDLTSGDTNWRPEGFTVGGTARTPQNKPTFGQERVPVHIWQPDPVELTMELLEDSDVDLEGLLRDLFAEVMGFDQDLAFLLGDGDGKPEGILNSGAATVVVGDASTYATPGDRDNGFRYKRIVDIFVALASQYRQNAVWYFNSDTLGRLLSIESDDGHPLFPVNAIPGTLLGRPYWVTEFLDNGDTTAKKPIIFGDPRFYVIAERKQLGIVRLVERYAPNVALQPTARIGGQVVLKEAFRIGTVQA